ncbi:hypothetical protein [Paenibacillus chungangensis]|uniref:ABC transmembrane type-1 domain-containing protein n=1 Tax=Paenibacillus chungangensis TaxID=696535 RepID=A0ABW3HRS5_9BACL
MLLLAVTAIYPVYYSAIALISDATSYMTHRGLMLLNYGVSHWNAWFHAMIFLRSRELYSLQLILREILISGETTGMVTGTEAKDTAMLGETLKYAAIMVATVPIFCVYPFLQRFLPKARFSEW